MKNTLGVSLAVERPELTGLAQVAAHCWYWLGGWYPERLPLYLALYPFDDVHELLARLLVIRGHVDQPSEG